jgi:hypothetical protein
MLADRLFFEATLGFERIKPAERYPRREKAVSEPMKLRTGRAGARRSRTFGTMVPGRGFLA